MNELSKILEIPSITTEHYREVFGPTVNDFNLTGRVFQKRYLLFIIIFILFSYSFKIL